MPAADQCSTATPPVTLRRCLMSCVTHGNRRSGRASTAQGWAATSNRSGASALGQDRLLPLTPMWASSACAFLCRAAFPFVVSDVVRYTWLSTGTHPSGWARSPNRALGCGDCSPSFCVLLPGVQGQAAPGFGQLEDTLRVSCPNRRARRDLGPCPPISQVPAAPGRRCDAVCRAGLLAVADIHPAGDRGPSRLAGAAGAAHGEDLPLTGNVFEALLAMGSQVDG
jgi:hypothetical protein